MLHRRQRIHKQPAAQHRSALRRMAASGSQQQPAAAAVVGRTSSSRASGPRAKLSSPQLPLHAPQPFLPAQPPALLQPTTLPAVAPNSRAGGIPDSILQANGTAAGSSRLQVSSAGQTVSASTGQAPDSTSAADDDAAPSSGAAEPSTGSSPAEETVDMPADQVPPVAGVSEKVLERAKQLEKDDKAAQSPGTVLPPTVCPCCLPYKLPAHHIGLHGGCSMLLHLRCSPDPYLSLAFSHTAQNSAGLHALLFPAYRLAHAPSNNEHVVSSCP